jgi:ribosomal protein S18 acetylase RimI-like enzyme
MIIHNKPGTETILIRKVTRADLPALEWDGEYLHFRNLFRDAYQRARKGDSVLWVAEISKIAIIGQVFVQLIGSRPELADGKRRAYIYSVRVRLPYRGMGIGTQMMHTVELDLLQRGFSLIALNVAKNNPKARSFYEQRGYQVIADEPGNWSYIDHRGKRCYVHEPAWRMEKALCR